MVQYVCEVGDNLKSDDSAYHKTASAKKIGKRHPFNLNNQNIATRNLAKKLHGMGVEIHSYSFYINNNLEPDLVINDILDTSEQEILILKDTGIRVVNFEDLGSGAVCTDLTINELYDVPKFVGNNVLWGRDYFFVRDEFLSAHPNKFSHTVSDVLLTFGGTDQHDLSRKSYRSIRSLCESQSINIHIVTGPGYRNYEELAAEVTGDDLVYLTHATGVISSIMGKVQLAITSNGRTVYELAHMNIPSIVISQHDRECTHAFAREENGVTPLDLYEENVTERKAIEEFEKLVFDVERRLKLYDKIKAISFSGNKRKVISIILGTLKS